MLQESKCVCTRVHMAAFVCKRLWVNVWMYMSSLRCEGMHEHGGIRGRVSVGEHVHVCGSVCTHRWVHERLYDCIHCMRQWEGPRKHGGTSVCASVCMNVCVQVNTCASALTSLCELICAFMYVCLWVTVWPRMSGCEHVCIFKCLRGSEWGCVCALCESMRVVCVSLLTSAYPSACPCDWMHGHVCVRPC